MGPCVAAWSLSGVQHDTWRIHSSLILPTGSTIFALDCKSGSSLLSPRHLLLLANVSCSLRGLLAIGCQNTLSVYTLILENDLPTWSQKWTHTYALPFICALRPFTSHSSVATPTRLCFSPSLMYIAAASQVRFCHDAHMFASDMRPVR